MVSTAIPFSPFGPGTRHAERASASRRHAFNEAALVCRFNAGDETVLTGEFSDLVARCMERLNASQRQILTLRNSLNRSYGEIARELGISVGTVKSRIACSRTNLRALLAETCAEHGEEAVTELWFSSDRPDGRIPIASA